ncbi:MAG: hypothetical protein FJ253_10760 [Phycisphaerae bacterium]|nr:hypothetical protein [Phycisphaerae bacterium]
MSNEPWRVNRACIAALALLVSGVADDAAWAQERTRIASYNIKFLEAGLESSNPVRFQNLRETLDELDADLIALQEIRDRPALLQFFPASDWSVVIDDSSGSRQDLAVAVRKPLKLLQPSNGVATDADFLFPSTSDDDSFPERRDVLAVKVGVPTDRGDVELWLLVLHPKARHGGRHATEPRRVSAAIELLRVLERDFDDQGFVLLGDINDNPDDRAVNILETGDPAAPFEQEERDGPFLINLMDSLVRDGHVSHGRSSSNIVASTGRIDTVDANSRGRNADGVNTDANTGDILFDQMLIPMRMRNAYVGGSAQVFDGAAAVRGNDDTRASDHLPVVAEFEFTPPAPEGGAASGSPVIRIASMLPDPAGADAGHETITLRNDSVNAVDLQGWRLLDRAGNDFELSGSIPALSTLVIQLPAGAVPLNNDGDEITVLGAGGQLVSVARYDASQVRSGMPIAFP